MKTLTIGRADRGRLGLSLRSQLHGASLTLGDNAPGLRVVLAFEEAAGAEG